MMIPKGDPRESRILELLQKWLDANFSPKDQGDLCGSYGTRTLSELERSGALCIAAIEKINLCPTVF